MAEELLSFRVRATEQAVERRGERKAAWGGEFLLSQPYW